MPRDAGLNGNLENAQVVRIHLSEDEAQRLLSETPSGIEVIEGPDGEVYIVGQAAAVTAFLQNTLPEVKPVEIYAGAEAGMFLEKLLSSAEKPDKSEEAESIVDDLANQSQPNEVLGNHSATFDDDVPNATGIVMDGLPSLQSPDGPDIVQVRVPNEIQAGRDMPVIADLPDAIINNAAVFAGPAGVSQLQGGLISISLDSLFTDPEGAPLDYVVSGLPSWLSYNASTHVIYGTPGPYDIGNFFINVDAADAVNHTVVRLAINVVNVNDAPLPITDGDTAANEVNENALTGTAVGLRAHADDLDADTITYALTDDAGGRFAIDSASGVVTVANGGLLNYEAASSHTITVVASDGALTSTQTYTINLLNVAEAPGVINDINAAANTIAENAANGAGVGLQLFAVDNDGYGLTYSLTDDAGGRFAIDAATGIVTVANGALLDFEGAASHTITVEATDGSLTSSQSFTINLTNVNEAPYNLVDSDAAANTVAENVANGTVVGVTALASDYDAATTLTYSLSDSAGGRFAINASTGVITVANGALLNFENATSHNVTVVASDGTLTTSQTFTINVSNVNEAPYNLVDSNAAANSLAENSANGTVVAITAAASDVDAGTTLTYSLSNDAGGRFAINSATGVVTVADGSLLDYDTGAAHLITVVVSDGALTTSQTFTINLTNVNEAPYNLVDNNAAANAVAENVANGTVVGVTALASDYDAGTTLTYSLSDNAGGRFAINASTGVITVANGALLNFENATSHTVTVVASDGSLTASQTFTINLTDVNEAPYNLVDSDAAANTIAENVANGTVVGITALASDYDAATTLTYSLSNNAGGRFAIDATTGEITVANGALLNYEGATSHTITVVASDGALTTSQNFTINVTNVNEAPYNLVDNNAAANTIAENATNGTVVGVTALASDYDAGTTLTYSLSDNAGGRFAINASTGVVTVADGSLLNFENATSHTITVVASDGALTTAQTFTINVTNVNEAPTGLADTDAAANSLAENSANGTVVGITALASDVDAGTTLTYSLSNNAGGRFAINASTGVITVANGALLNYEGATSHSVTVVASDGSLTTSQSFTINLTDVNEAPTGISDSNAGANTVAENAANGTIVGVTALGADVDAGTTLTYSLSNDAGGRFTIDAGTGVISVADGSLLNYEGATSHVVTVVASDGSLTTSQNFTIAVSNVNEAPYNLIDNNAAANSLAENAANGTVVGVTALASDVDASTTLTYSLSDNAGGRFAINATTGVITVANGALLNYENATSHNVTVVASDGSLTTSQSFTINLTDVNEAPTGLADTDVGANAIAENSANGTVVGVTALASDVDAGTTLTYSLSNDAGGRFQINASTGVITVANGTLLNYEGATSHSVTVVASDGSLTTSQSFTIGVTNVNEAPYDIVDGTGVADTVAENATNGTTVGIDAVGFDYDAGTTLTYSLSDDAGGRFQINATTGKVTVANGTLLNYENATSHTITVVASDGSLSTSRNFTIAVTNVNEAPTNLTDTNAAANSLAENSANGTAVGITALASDADAATTLTYSLSDNAGGRFAINSTTGVITVANSSLLNYENATSHNVTVVASDGSLTATQTFTINLTNVNEAPTGLTDANAGANTLAENTANGTVVAITAQASDVDAGTTLTYSLSNDAGGRFAINTSTGVVSVANSSLLNYESATSHTITVVASDGSLSTSQTFTISLTDVSEAPTDISLTSSSVNENVAVGTTIATLSATDPDATGNTFSYTIIGDPDGVFQLAANVLKTNATLNHEAYSSHQVTIRVSDGANTYSETFTINVNDINDVPVVANQSFDVAENSTAGTQVTRTDGSNPLHTLTGFDEDGNALTWSIVSGNSANNFQINAATGEITVKAGANLNFESASTYTLGVVANDGTANSATAFITINVTNVNEAPYNLQDINATGNSVSEGAANGAAVGVTVAASDYEGNPVTYSLSDNAGGRFAINGTTGVVTVANASLLDYDTASSHTITVVASDGSLSSSQSFTINLTNVNEAPVFNDTTYSVAENSALNTVVATFGATDVDAGDTRSYTILSGNGAGIFSVNGSGQLLIASSPNYEAATSYTLTVRVTDAGGLTDDATITVNISNVNEAPVVNNQAMNVLDTATNGDAVGTVAGTDVDAGALLTWSIVSGNNGAYAINATTGEITVSNASLIGSTTQVLVVRATDQGGLSDTGNVTITVNEVNDTPVVNNQTFTIGENLASGGSVGTVASTDPEGNTLVYSIVGADHGLFAIDSSTGVLRLINGQNFDYESQTSYTLTVKVKESGTTEAYEDTATITVNVTNINEAPGTVSDSDAAANTLAENSTNGTVVGITAAATDPEGTTLTYSLTNNAGGRFAIDSSTGIITVANGALLNYEGATSHTITVRASDGVNTTDQVFTINLTNVNEAPTNNVPTSKTVSEDVATALTGLSVTEQDGDTISVALSVTNGTLTLATNVSGGITAGSISGNGTNSITISGVTADALNQTLANATGLVYTSTLNYNGSDTLTIVSSDGTLTDTDTLAITVSAVNDAPTTVADIPDDGITSAETWSYTVSSAIFNDLEGNALTWSATKADGTALPSFITFNATTHTFTIGSAPGTGNVGSYSFKVTATDTGGLSTFQTFTLNISAPGLTPPGGSDDTTPFTVTAGSGNDTITGGAGNDTLFGGSGGQDTIFGMAGNDTIHADRDATGNYSYNSDTVYGGDGNDVIYGDIGDDPNAGISTAPDVLYGEGGNDIIYGQVGNDTIDGGDGTDTLYGGYGNDTIRGGNDADTIRGGFGNDTIDGGDGGDLILGDAGNDTITGGAGADTFQYLSLAHSQDSTNFDTITDFDASVDKISVSTFTGIVQGVGAASGQTLGWYQVGSGPTAKTIITSDQIQYKFYLELTGHVTLSASNFTFTGTYGTSGADVMNGTSGNDTILALGGNDTITINQGGTDSAFGGDGNDTIVANADATVYGENGNDTITFGSNATIYGGAGDDILNFVGASSAFVYGGDGADTFKFSTYFNPSGAYIEDFVVGVDKIDVTTLFPITGLYTSAQDATRASELRMYYDSVSGYTVLTTSNTVLWGTVLARLKGNYVTNSDTSLNLNFARDFVSNPLTDGSVNDSDARAGYIAGTAGVDTFLGSAGNDVIFMQGGDHVAAMAGNDMVVSRAPNTNITVDLGAGTNRFFVANASVSGSTLALSTNVNATDTYVLNTGRAYIQGNNLGNGTYILAGNTDEMSAGDGTDTIYGFGGSDTMLRGGNGNDYINGGEGNDGLQYGLSGDANNDILIGGYGQDYIWGDQYNNTSSTDYADEFFVYDPRESIAAAQDVIFDFDSLDKLHLYGFTGIDGTATGLTVTHYTTTQFGFVNVAWTDLTASGGDTTFKITFMGNLTFNVGSNLILHAASLGTSGADTLNGTTGDDVLLGQVGNDTLYGNDGLDLLFGGDGNDILYGQVGADEIYGGAGNDSIRGGAGVDRLEGNSGVDTFVFDIGDSTSTNIDTIWDFKKDNDADVLDLSALDPTNILSFNDLVFQTPDQLGGNVTRISLTAGGNDFVIDLVGYYEKGVDITAANVIL